MNSLPEYTAEFYNGGKRHRPIVQIIHNPFYGREIIETIEVSGKRDARKIAIDRNAICWNF